MTDTPSPRLGALSRLRRNKGRANASANSLTNSSNDDENAGGGLLSSVDAAIDKVKERTTRRSDDEPISTRSRLASLVPGRRRSIRSSHGPDGQRRGSQQSSSGLPSPMNDSDSSLLDGSGHSSLLTDGDHSDDG